MSKNKSIKAIELLSNTQSQINIMSSLNVENEAFVLEDFDIVCVETCFTTIDSSRLFAWSLRKHAQSLIDKIRVLFFINNAQVGLEKQHFTFMKEIKTILKNFNLVFIRVEKSDFNKYNYGWGKVNENPSSLSHGLIIYEYLKKYSHNMLFSLLCHSDTEFTMNMKDYIFDWQKRLMDPDFAGIALHKIHDNGAIFMNSWFSFWKNPILYEYAVLRDIPLYAINQLEIGGRFYDTGSYLQCFLEKHYKVEYAEIRQIANHWGSMTSNAIYDKKTDRSKLDMIKERILLIQS